MLESFGPVPYAVRRKLENGGKIDVAAVDTEKEWPFGLQEKLLGQSERWDSGELAFVFKRGLTLSAIENCPGLLEVPWGNARGSGMTRSEVVKETLLALIGGDDPNLKSLQVLIQVELPLSKRLVRIAELHGQTTSRTGRNHLKKTILPWFYKHLKEYLEANGAIADAPSEPEVPEICPVEVEERAVWESLRSPIDPAGLAEVLKQRLVQVALDVSDLDKAADLARVAAIGQTDLIEVGDPLVRRFGMAAVERIRAEVPTVPLVVEVSSSDWVDDQIKMAADAGADLVMILGVSRAARIEKAVEAARANRVGLVLGLPRDVEVDSWCSDVEQAGVDAVAVIRNIDSASPASETLGRLRAVQSCVDMPVFISGGYTPGGVAEVADEDWNVVVVGRSFVNAREPSKAIEKLVTAVRGVACR